MPHASLSSSAGPVLSRARRARAHFATLALAATCAMATLVAPAQAVVGAVDNVPAATLLLPYFEVDLNNANGTQTSFTVVNTARAPTLAHVTLWTDYAVPTYSFDLYLGGRDTVAVDLRLLFTKGIIAQTAPGLGTAGPMSDPHAALVSCSPALPLPDQLAAQLIPHLRAAHTGVASGGWAGLCGGATLGDNIARGYITIDQANSCSSLFPSDAGYFLPGGTGVAGNLNVLAGQYTQLNRTTMLAITDNLIAIEASSTSPVTTTFDNTPAPTMAVPLPPPDIRTAYTFYGRYVAGAADQREPLASRYAGRFQNGGAFPTGTTVTVWRDFDRAPGQTAMPFACNSPPAPMPSRESIFFDEQENAFFPGGAPVPDSQPLPGFQPTIFPRATQRVHTSTLNAQSFGWARLDLNNPNSPGFFNGARQGHVSFQRLSNGRFGGSANGHQDWNVSEWALRAPSSASLPGPLN